MEFTREFIVIPGTPFGDLQLRFYGILIVTGMLVAAFMAARLARRDKRDPDHIWGALTWAIPPGMIGARLWYITFPPISAPDASFFYSNFFDLDNGAIAIWSGGLHLYGAILGGFLGFYLYFSATHNTVGRISHYIFLPLTALYELIVWAVQWVISKARGKDPRSYELPQFQTNFPDEGLPILPWLDYAGVVLPLAQAIGRLGNYLNQELYGTPTNLPWGISIDREKRVGEYTNGVEYPFDGPDETLFHPLFLYEALWNLVAFFVLLRIFTQNRERFRTGDFFLLYVMQYTFVRFFLEFIRIEQALVEIGGFEVNTSQFFAAAAFVIALGIFVIRRLDRGGEKQPQPAMAAATTADISPQVDPVDDDSTEGADPASETESSSDDPKSGA